MFICSCFIWASANSHPPCVDINEIKITKCGFEFLLIHLELVTVKLQGCKFELSNSEIKWWRRTTTKSFPTTSLLSKCFWVYWERNEKRGLHFLKSQKKTSFSHQNLQQTVQSYLVSVCSCCQIQSFCSISAIFAQNTFDQNNRIENNASDAWTRKNKTATIFDSAEN